LRQCTIEGIHVPNNSKWGRFKQSKPKFIGRFEGIKRLIRIFLNNFDGAFNKNNSVERSENGKSLDEICK
jgi:hypothetical protein